MQLRNFVSKKSFLELEQIRSERDRKINETTRSFYVLLSQTEQRQKLTDKIDFIDLKMKRLEIDLIDFIDFIDFWVALVMTNSEMRSQSSGQDFKKFFVRTSLLEFLINFGQNLPFLTFLI